LKNPIHRVKVAVDGVGFMMREWSFHGVCARAG
jgi:hypothetical protein